MQIDAVMRYLITLRISLTTAALTRLKAKTRPMSQGLTVMTRPSPMTRLHLPPMMTMMTLMMTMTCRILRLLIMRPRYPQGTRRTTSRLMMAVHPLEASRTSSRTKEDCKVITCDIPGAFMQANIDKQLFLKFDGDLVELLIQVDPTYQPYVTYEGKQPVLYMELDKALYGTLQAALLFWQKLSTFLIDKHGFEWNKYDWCIVNKMIKGKQCTIAWYIDDIKMSHAQ